MTDKPVEAATADPPCGDPELLSAYFRDLTASLEFCRSYSQREVTQANEHLMGIYEATQAPVSALDQLKTFFTAGGIDAFESLGNKLHSSVQKIAQLLSGCSQLPLPVEVVHWTAAARAHHEAIGRSQRLLQSLSLQLRLAVAPETDPQRMVRAVQDALSDVQRELEVAATSADALAQNAEHLAIRIESIFRVLQAATQLYSEAVVPASRELTQTIGEIRTAARQTMVTSHQWLEQLSTHTDGILVNLQFQDRLMQMLAAAQKYIDRIQDLCAIAPVSSDPRSQS